MFTRTNKLKVIFKEAHEDHALDIGLTNDNVYIIRGHIFTLICPAEIIDNDVLAELVKLTGGLPSKGEAISYVKNDEPQMTRVEFIEEDLNSEWEKAENVVTATRMIISSGSDIQVVYQTNKLEKIMVPARLHNCIGLPRGDNEEMQPIHITADGYLIAVSNEMQFRFDQHKVKWIQEWEILDKCRDIDLNWSLVDVNLYQ